MLNVRRLSAALWLGCCLAPAATGQAGFAISGIVRDSQGSAIPAAAVTLVARDNSMTAAVTADGAGRYRFVRVSSGVYLLEASAAQFENSGARPVSVDKGDVSSVDFELRVASVQTRVVVTATGTAQTTDELAKAVSTVDSDAIDLRDQYSVAD